MCSSKWEVCRSTVCQWDVYPEGQGKTVFEFIKSEMNTEAFCDHLDAIKIRSPEYIEAL
jgi:hypothetical protein